MDSGQYSWVINGTLLQAMLNASNGQTFTSHIFQIGHLNWQIEACPNGYKKDQIGHFNVYITLLSCPNKWKSLTVHRRIYCEETESCSSNISVYKKDKSMSWPSGTLLLNEIKHLSLTQIKLTVRISILKITKADNGIVYQNPMKMVKHSSFSWLIGSQTLNKMKNAYTGKRFESSIFDNMWLLQICPNGQNIENKGDCLLCLSLCILPQNISRVTINYKFECKELNVSTEDTEDFDYSNHDQFWSLNSLAFEKIKNYNGQTLMINVEIAVLNIYDIDGKDETETKWDQYLRHSSNDNEEKDEISGKFTMMQIRQKFEAQEQRINALTMQLAQMQNYNLLIQELNSKIAMIVNTIKEKAVMDNKTDNQLSVNQSYMMNQINELKSQMETMAAIQTEEKEESETKQLKNFFSKILKLDYYQMFVDDGYDDLESIMNLKEEDLEKIGVVKNGHKKKIIREIQKLVEQNQEQMDWKNYCTTWICVGCHTMNLSETILCTSCGQSRSNTSGSNQVEGIHLADTLN